ncbi:hypothetical protein SH139x_004073 [Planctomycetaceae bacterium SH139]
MSRFTSFLFGMVVGAMLLGGAMHYHFVRSSQGLLMVPKISKGLADTYTDIREFELADWQEHRALAAALVKSDKAELLADNSLTNFRQSINGVLDGLFGPKE